MRHHSQLRRSGFTMMELLIVIAVISILMTLLVSAAFSFIVNAKEAATATTITKVSGLIQERIRSFHDPVRDAEFKRAAERLFEPNQAFFGSAEVAEIFVRKQRFKQAFPQSFTEADSQRFGVAPTGVGYQSRFESGILLYLILTKGETFGTPSPGDDAFSGPEVRISTETGGMPCLVDAWGEPLRFYRWPTRLFRCGESHLDSSTNYDDYNQNATDDAAGIIPGPFPPLGGAPTTMSPIIRPTTLLPGPTPASLLISTLPPFDRNDLNYARGPDRSPGFVGCNDDGKGIVDDVGEIGWPNSDDPESLNTDPDDQTYRLSGFFEKKAAEMDWVPAIARQTDFIKGFHDFYTFHTPLIVSAGPDRLLGLRESTDVPRPAFPNSQYFGYLAMPISPIRSNLQTVRVQDTAMGQLTDNITNHNQRAGGK